MSLSGLKELAFLRQANRASYSATLFVALPIYPPPEYNTLPSSSRKITPMPLSPGFPREAPSVCA